MMKHKLLLAAFALLALGGSTSAQMTTHIGSDQPTTQSAKPDTTDLEAMFEYIKTLPPSNEQLQQYLWLINKLEAGTPADRDLLVRTLCNTGVLLLGCNQLENARTCFDEALKYSSQLIDEGVARGWMLDGAVRLNRTNAFDADDPDRLTKRVRDLDIAVSEFDDFIKNKDATPEDIENNVLPTRILALICSACDYHYLKEYDKALARGTRALDLWKNSDEEFRQSTLYFRYFVSVVMCQSAERRRLTDRFQTLANDVESFFGNVSEQLQAGKLTMDDQTRHTIAGLLTIHMTSYSELNDLDRARQIGALALTFDTGSASIINYEFCKALLENDEPDEARKLHAEILKDEAFVKEYLKDEDIVQQQLDQLAESGQKKLSEQDLSRLTSSINQNISQMSAGGQFSIKGLTAECMEPRKERGGRVVLPVDRFVQSQVGVSFRLGR